jgi:hypothetical protein
MLERLISADVNLVLSLDPAAGAIRADAGHIEQVIMNLVVNAKDAMPNGGKLVIETAHRDVDERFAESLADVVPGQYAALTVSDTGTGIFPKWLTSSTHSSPRSNRERHGTRAFNRLWDRQAMRRIYFGTQRTRGTGCSSSVVRHRRRSPVLPAVSMPGNGTILPR